MPLASGGACAPPPHVCLLVAAPSALHCPTTVQGSHSRAGRAPFHCPCTSASATAECPSAKSTSRVGVRVAGVSQRCAAWRGHGHGGGMHTVMSLSWYVCFVLVDHCHACTYYSHNSTIPHLSRSCTTYSAWPLWQHCAQGKVWPCTHARLPPAPPPCMAPWPDTPS